MIENEHVAVSSTPQQEGAKLTGFDARDARLAEIVAVGIADRTNESDRSRYFWDVHRNLNEQIRFADTKASVVIAACGAMTAYFLTDRDLLQRIVANPIASWSSVEWLLLLTGGLLTAALLASAYVVVPRLMNPQDKGYIHWDSIRSHTDAATFVVSADHISRSDLRKHLFHHIHTLSVLCARKYGWLRIAMATGLSAAVSSGVLVFLRATSS